MVKTKGGKGKARQQAPQPRIILYGLEAGSDRETAIRKCAADLGISVRSASTDDLGEAVGALAGLRGFKKRGRPYDGPAPEKEFALLCNLPQELFDGFLNALREADCSVDLKAAVTQSNRLWPLHQLIEQVAEEHAAMHGNRTAN